METFAIIILLLVLLSISILFLQHSKMHTLSKRVQELEEENSEQKKTIIFYGDDSSASTTSEKNHEERKRGEAVIRDETDDSPALTLEEADEFETAGSERRQEILKKFIMTLLRRMDTQPEEQEEKGDILVGFQGETFIIKVSPVLVTVIDPAWASIEADSPKFNILRTALNLSNHHTFYMGLMALPDNDGEVNISSAYTFPFYPSFKHPLDFLRFVLNGAFEYKKIFRSIVGDLMKGNRPYDEITVSVGNLTNPNEN